MHVKDLIMPRYLNLLLSNPRGRAFILTQLADAEDTDEGRFFDVLLERVDDPKLLKAITRHKEDEERHAKMFRECAARTGATAPVIPDNLRLIGRLDQAFDGFFERVTNGEWGVLEAYALLQVIEERAITQFKLFEPAFRKIDPKTADVLVEIAKDEERHLKYCQAITKRYATSDAQLERLLSQYRKVEARVFTENGSANLQFCLDQNLLDVGWAGGLFWQGIVNLSKHRNEPEFTSFAAAH